MTLDGKFVNEEGRRNSQSVVMRSDEKLLLVVERLKVLRSIFVAVLKNRAYRKRYNFELDRG